MSTLIVPPQTLVPTPTLVPPTSSAHSLRSLSDDQLLHRLAELVRDSRRVEAELVAHIAVVGERRLFLREACSSMFSYCVEVLHLSEPETALRIVVARASRRHPALLPMLRDGRLHLSGIARLAPHLTEHNRDGVLARAALLSKRRIEELVAELAPRPDVPAFVRKLPEQGLRPRPHRADDEHRPDDVHPADDVVGRVAQGPFTPGDPAEAGPAPTSPAPAWGRQPTRPRSPAVVEPLAPARYKVQFTASASLRHKLERLQVLMSGTVPDGDLAAIIEAAVSEKIERLEAKRLGAAKRPRRNVAQSDTRPGPRHVPAAVKRAVRARDGERCAYVDVQGRRCSERRQLQFHHRHPHGLGGDRSPANISLRCPGHNRHEAQKDYGTRHCGNQDVAPA